MDATPTLPYLVVETATASPKQILLPSPGERLLIGCDQTKCQLVVHSDAQKSISREHCEIWGEDGVGWLLVDKSTNGTQLRSKEGDEVDLYDIPERSVLMFAGDHILLPSHPKALYTLTVTDPNRTRDYVDPQQRRPELAYRFNLTRQVLYVAFRGRQWQHRESRNLRQQAMILLIAMAEKNYRFQGEVTCSREELITAVWGELASDRTDEDLNKLVGEVKKNFKDIPDLIKTKKGVGFLLNAKGFKD